MVWRGVYIVRAVCRNDDVVEKRDGRNSLEYNEFWHAWVYLCADVGIGEQICLYDDVTIALDIAKIFDEV